MSNEPNTQSSVSARNTLSFSGRSAMVFEDRMADVPPVPITADLPMLPEVRSSAQGIDWRTAITRASLAGFLAVIAGVGCGTRTELPKPSPARAALDGSISPASGPHSR